MGKRIRIADTAPLTTMALSKEVDFINDPRLLPRRAILFVMHQTMRPRHDPATTPADR
jgi:hypothetical protein